MSKPRPRPRLASSTLAATILTTAAATLGSGSSALAQTSRSSASVPRPLALAASASTRTDRRLVAAAGALKKCVRTHPAHLAACKADRLAVQRAGSSLATAQRSLATIARRTGTSAGSRSASTSAAGHATTLSIHGQTLTWTRVSHVRAYVLSRKVPGQPEADVLVTGTSATPPPVPGVTVGYTVRAAVTGSTWSAEQSIAYAGSVAAPGAPSAGTGSTEPVNTQAAPTLSASGETITWSLVGNVTTYVLETLVPGQAAQYSEVSGTSLTPAKTPGKTVSFSVRTAVDGSAWSPLVTIAFPSEQAQTQAPSTPLSGPKIIGTNDGAGWGADAAATIIGGHITWNRVEVGSSSNTTAQSVADGFHTLAIVGNTEDEVPLSQVNPASWGQTVVSQLQANPGISIAEAGNEMYLKGDQANPVRYGEMYLAAINDMKAAGIHTQLLFNMTGDVPTGTWASPTSWSADAVNGGWLRDAVSGVPGLAAAIIANGISIHPYGGLEEDKEDSAGVRAVPAEEAVAHTVLGSTPSFYITEFGYNMAACGSAYGACSQEEQASKTGAALKALLADPHVAGIWLYQSHDDGTGQFGYMNNDGTTRPLFGVLSSFAAEQGQ